MLVVVGIDAVFAHLGWKNVALPLYIAATKYVIFAQAKEVSDNTRFSHGQVEDTM